MKSTTPILSLFFLLLSLLLFANCRSSKQNSRESKIQIWSRIPASELKQSRDSLPKKFVAYYLNEEALRDQLKLDSTKMTAVIELPLSDSSFAQFSVMEIQVMSPALAAKYPKFKTYEGFAVNSSTNRVRIDFNDKNFHAYFMTSNGEHFITPVDGDEKNYYMVFKKEDSSFPKLPFEEGKK